MQALLDIYGTHPFWVWAGVVAALLAVEVATGSGWMLWPAGAAAVVGMVSMFFPQLPAGWAILLFAAITIAAALLGRKFFPRRATAEGEDINDPASRIIGHHGRAVAAFEDGEGRVFVDGKEWPAHADTGEPLAIGDAIEVTGVTGALLNVRRR